LRQSFEHRQLPCQSLTDGTGQELQFAERVRAGYREERFYGASDLPNFYRKPYGPGWALAGYAGLHKDPFLALGICDALRDVEVRVAEPSRMPANSSGLCDPTTNVEPFTSFKHTPRWPPAT
jgi:hypothetical protein